MSRTRLELLRARRLLPAILTSLLLTACGGGGDSSAPTTTAPTQTFLAQQATDSFNLFNTRRQQTGLAILARNAFVDAAAQGHSNYQALNDTITHTQIAGNPGFTAVKLGDTLDPNKNCVVLVPGRLTVAGYQFGPCDYAYGEVIAKKTGDTSGVNAANDLITAIFHRFVIFEPMFKDAGAGAATSASGATYFTTDFAANGLDRGLGAGKFVVYPYANQTDIPTVFMSDTESPDPVPTRNAVGFPISVHADIISTVTVTTFTVQPRGGAPLQVQPLTHAANPETPNSAAAIIPLDVLTAGTVYDVAFTGTVYGVAATRNWSFTTR